MTVKSANDSQLSVAGARLLALDPSLQHHEYKLPNERSTAIGRDVEMCDIVVTGATISRKHCRIEPVSPGSYRLVDLRSTNGVYVNDRRVEGSCEIGPGDLVGLGAIGHHHFRVEDGSGAGTATVITLPARRQWSIGRAETNDICLANESTVSGEHARIRVHKNGLMVEDRGSRNGSWLNGSRVRSGRIGPTDSLVIGDTVLHLELLEDGSLKLRRRELGGRFEIDCVNARCEVTDGVGQRARKRLLDDICLAVRPGEFVGLLGPSGAGKSTLLTTLSGSNVPARGAVLVNQSPLHVSLDMYRTSIGYVPQDDIIHSELTVEQSLDYIAKLRLSPDLSAKERTGLVDTTIESLRLSHVKRSRVDQLSGGQRKRVSIGAELITRPSALFLDEPTSGMDPSTEERLMLHFKDLAEHGTTVLITTHILYNLDLLDRVVILSQGRLVFFGTPDEARVFFSPDGTRLTRTTTIFDILEGDDPSVSTMSKRGEDHDSRDDIARHFQEKYRASELFQHHVVDKYSDVARDMFRVNSEQSNSSDSTGTTTQRQYIELINKPGRGQRKVGLTSMDGRNVRILASRMVKIKLGSIKRLGFYLAVPFILALVTLSLYAGSLPDDVIMSDKRSGIQQQIEQGPPGVGAVLKHLFQPDGGSEELSAVDIVYGLKYEGMANLPISMSVVLMFVMTSVFMGTLMACMEVSSERSIYRRERQAGLNIADYLVSKLPFLFSLTALQCVVFLAICFIRPEMRQIDFLWAYLGLLGMAWASCAVGLFISSMDPTPGQMSVVLAIVVVLPQLVLSGGLGPEYYSGMSSVMQVMASVLPARWGLEMLMTGFFHQPGIQSLEWIPSFVMDTVGFDFGYQVIVLNLWLLAFLCTAWLVGTAVVLKLRE